MKGMLAMGMVLVAAAIAVGEMDNAAKTRCITSRYRGKIYESCITVEQFDRMPSWDPMEREPIPVSPGQAIGLARSVLERYVQETERKNWVIKRVELLHYDDRYPPSGYSEVREQKWHYVIQFWNKTNPEVASFPTPPAIREKQEEFNIFVLLSGEACVPVPREDETDLEPSIGGGGKAKGK